MNEKLRAAIAANQKPLAFDDRETERARRIEQKKDDLVIWMDEANASGTRWDSKVQREGLTGKGKALRTQRKNAKRKGHRRNNEESRIINRIDRKGRRNNG